MNTIQFNNLECHLESLIKHLLRLQAENATLRKKLMASAQECSKLYKKQQIALGKINFIIGRLQEKLHDS